MKNKNKIFLELTLLKVQVNFVNFMNIGLWLPILGTHILVASRSLKGQLFLVELPADYTGMSCLLFPNDQVINV